MRLGLWLGLGLGLGLALATPTLVFPTTPGLAAALQSPTGYSLPSTATRNAAECYSYCSEYEATSPLASLASLQVRVRVRVRVRVALPRPLIRTLSLSLALALPVPAYPYP